MVKKKKNKKVDELGLLRENLQDPVYVNYNILAKLEEIKKINFAMLEILNVFYQKFMEEEEPKEPKEQREGVFKKS